MGITKLQMETRKPQVIEEIEEKIKGAFEGKQFTYFVIAFNDKGDTMQSLCCRNATHANAMIAHLEIAKDLLKQTLIERMTAGKQATVKTPNKADYFG